ncbi:hypothetical protein K8B33_08395 [Alcanivorax sp. JB21]|uniref:hypothetical protein n=1 Tax=Alcanivorax limicola TaxID=2874102 RepID=UPI001CBCE9B8|nr:hypothetical protein [Alcanivorax limicola]MBZ2189114.1 hypothetical protein [Alcanivorax limicola]
MGRTGAVINWAPLALGTAHKHRVRILCRRMLGRDTLLIEDATDFVLRELARDNWSRCLRFQGKAKPDTWLYLLSVQLIREYRKRLLEPPGR